MTRHDPPPLPTPPRRLRAALVGLGLDDDGGPRRVLNGRECLVVGGGADTHAELTETMLRLEFELERRGVRLGDVAPDDLAEIACRIDSPELLEIALNLGERLNSDGRTFADATPEELTRMSAVSA